MNLNKEVVNSDEISLKELILRIRDWFKYLLSKWGVIILFGIIGSAIGFLYANMKQMKYISKTTFVLEEDKGGGSLGSLSGLASIAGVDLGSSGGGIFQGDNILELYKSRNMIEKALLANIEYKGKKQLLVDRFIDFNNMRDSWKNKPALKDLDFSYRDQNKESSRAKDSILSGIIGDINRNYLRVTKPDKKLSIISAQVTADDEFFAKIFNEKIVKTVNDFYVQTKTKKSADNVNILQQKVDSVRTVMNGAIYSSASVADATPNLNPTKQIQRVAPMQRAQFSAETNRMILSELVKNLELSKIALRKETPLIQVIDSPVLPLEVEKLGRLKGIILGGALFGILIVAFFTVKFILKNILSE